MGNVFNAPGYSETYDKAALDYEGADQLLQGYLLCRNHDSGTATVADFARCGKLEKPATGNLHAFAGVVEDRMCGVGPNRPTIIRPGTRAKPVLAYVYTDASCVINTTVLYIRPGTYAASDYGTYRIGVAAQTVDCSTVPGLVLAWLEGVSVPKRAMALHGRTAVQLPTAAIWDNFPLEEMRANPMLGSLFETDFTAAIAAFAGASTALTQNDLWIDAGATDMIRTQPGAAGIGTLVLTTAAAHSEVAWRIPCPIIASGGGKWALEARFNIDDITDAHLAGMFIGLIDGDYAMDGDELANTTGAMADKNDIGFHVTGTAGAGAGIGGEFLNYHYRDEGQAIVIATHATLVASAYRTAGIYYNGTDIVTYLDGVITANGTLAAVIAAVGFPTAGVLTPLIAMKQLEAATARDTMAVDWIRVAQIPTA